MEIVSKAGGVMCRCSAVLSLIITMGASLTSASATTKTEVVKAKSTTVQKEKNLVGQAVEKLGRGARRRLHNLNKLAGRKVVDDHFISVYGNVQAIVLALQNKNRPFLYKEIGLFLPVVNEYGHHVAEEVAPFKLWEKTDFDSIQAAKTSSEDALDAKMFEVKRQWE